MSTTGPVMTVTDELLAELEQQSVRDPGGAFPVRYAVISEITAELRRLRAENAGLQQVAKDVRWRVADTADQLQAYDYNGDRLYGLDEWSEPIRNLNIAICMLEKATQ